MRASCRLRSKVEEKARLVTLDFAELRIVSKNIV